VSCLKDFYKVEENLGLVGIVMHTLVQFLIYEWTSQLKFLTIFTKQRKADLIKIVMHCLDQTVSKLFKRLLKEEENLSLIGIVMHTLVQSLV
jgi:hypothetical protein